MKLSIKNISKPSNKKWKAVADYLLYTLPLFATAIMAVPIPENVKLWVNFGLTIIVIGIKGMSKFTSDEI